MKTSHRWAALGGLAVAAGVAALLALAEPRTAAQDGKGTQADKPGPSDHTMFGGTNDRNMVNLKDKNIPEKFDSEKDAIWKAELGSKAYGGPIIAGGRIYVGTNNARPRNPRDAKKTPDGEMEPLDKGIVMVF